MIFTCSLFVSSSKSLEHNPFTLLELCYVLDLFFLKAIAFFELSKTISFSIILTFLFSAMRLFKVMDFFSLDL